MPTITFTEDDFEAIEDGETVEKDGEKFIHHMYWQEASDGWIVRDDTLADLRDGETVVWKDGVEGIFEDYYDSNTVTLNTEVDTTGASEQQQAIYEAMADIFEQRFSLFVNKNLDYNSSFLTAGEVEQTLDSGGGPFGSADEANLYKLFTRIQDKNQRFYSLAFENNDDRVGESAAETAGDAAVYWFMVQWLIENEVDA